MVIEDGSVPAPPSLQAPDTARPRRLAWALPLGVVLLLVGVGVFNATVDPRGEFGNGRYAPVTDDRILALDYYEEGRDQYAVVLLGSSRAAMMEPGRLHPDEPDAAFNWAFEAASPEDMLYTYQHHRRGHDAPDAVVLALDAETFTQRDPPRLRSDLRYQHIVGRDGFADHYLWAKELVSKTYVDESWRTLQAAWAGEGPLARTAADGQWLHGQDPYSREQDEAGDPPPCAPSDVRREEQTARRGNNSRDRLAPYLFLAQPYQNGAALRPAMVAQTIALLDLLEADGVTVVAYLTPLHPGAIQAVHDLADYEDFRAVRQELAGIVRGHGAAPMVVDLTDIESFGGEACGFWDAQHMTANNAVRVADLLAGLLAQSAAA